MPKQRCKDCQYITSTNTCYRHRGVARSPYSQCIDYEGETGYHKSNHRDSIENIVNDIANSIEEEKCFTEPEESYKLEVLARKLSRLAEEHGIHSWKYD